MLVPVKSAGRGGPSGLSGKWNSGVTTNTGSPPGDAVSRSPGPRNSLGGSDAYQKSKQIIQANHPSHTAPQPGDVISARVECKHPATWSTKYTRSSRPPSNQWSLFTALSSHYPTLTLNNLINSPGDPSDPVLAARWCPWLQLLHVSLLSLCYM